MVYCRFLDAGLILCMVFCISKYIILVYFIHIVVVVVWLQSPLTYLVYVVMVQVGNTLRLEVAVSFSQ